MASRIQLVPGWGPGALFNVCPGCRPSDSRASNSDHFRNKVNSDPHRLSTKGDRAMRRGAARGMQAAKDTLCGETRSSQVLSVQGIVLPGVAPLGLSRDRTGGQLVGKKVGFGGSRQQVNRGRAIASALFRPESSINHREKRTAATSELEQTKLSEVSSSRVQHDRKFPSQGQTESTSERLGPSSVRFPRNNRGRAKPVEAPPSDRVWRRGGVLIPPAQTLAGTPLEQKPLSRTSVVVSNVPPETAQAEIESLFDAFGPLQFVELAKAGKGKMSAVVRFLEPWANESAAEAVLKGNGFVWKNHRLRVWFEGVEEGGANEGNGAGAAGSVGRGFDTHGDSNSSGVSNTSGVWKRDEVGNGALNGSRVSEQSEAPVQFGPLKRDQLSISDGGSDALRALEGGTRTRLREAAMQRPPDVRKVEHLFSQLLEVRVPKSHRIGQFQKLSIGLCKPVLGTYLTFWR